MLSFKISIARRPHKHIKSWRFTSTKTSQMLCSDLVPYMLPTCTCGFLSRSIIGHSLPNRRTVASSKMLPRKPGNVFYSTRFTNGILRITLLSRKHSVTAMMAAIPNLSNG